MRELPHSCRSRGIAVAFLPIVSNGQMVEARAGFGGFVFAGGRYNG